MSSPLASSPRAATPASILHALIVGALMLLAPAALAMPLDKESCDKLKAEKAMLEEGGARSAMGKGAQWAKDNLKPEQLARIQRMIDVDGQLLFRCNGRPLVVLPKEVDAEPAAPAAGEDGKEPTAQGHQGQSSHQGAAPREVAPAAAKAKAALGTGKPQPVPRDREASKKAAAEPTAGRQAKAASKAKVKVNDAYRPPQPADPGADPFAKAQDEKN
jgi:hypothetical protein